MQQKITVLLQNQRDEVRQKVTECKEELKLDDQDLTVDDFVDVLAGEDEWEPDLMERFLEIWHRHTPPRLPECTTRRHFPAHFLVKTMGMDASFELMGDAFLRYEFERYERNPKELFRIVQEDVHRRFAIFANNPPFGIRNDFNDHCVIDDFWNYLFRRRLGGQQIEEFQKCNAIFPNNTSVLLMTADWMNFVKDGMGGMYELHLFIRTQFEGKSQTSWNEWKQNFAFTEIGSLSKFGTWENVFRHIALEFKSNVCLMEIRERDICRGQIAVYAMAQDELYGEFGRSTPQAAIVMKTICDFVWLSGVKPMQEPLANECTLELPTRAHLGFGGKRLRLEDGHQLCQVLKRFGIDENRDNFRYQSVIVDSRDIAMDMSDLDGETWRKLQQFFEYPLRGLQVARTSSAERCTSATRPRG